MGAADQVSDSRFYPGSALTILLWICYQKLYLDVEMDNRYER